MIQEQSRAELEAVHTLQKFFHDQMSSSSILPDHSCSHGKGIVSRKYLPVLDLKQAIHRRYTLDPTPAQLPAREKTHTQT